MNWDLFFITVAFAFLIAYGLKNLVVHFYSKGLNDGGLSMLLFVIDKTTGDPQTITADELRKFAQRMRDNPFPCTKKEKQS